MYFLYMSDIVGKVLKRHMSIIITTNHIKSSKTFFTGKQRSKNPQVSVGGHSCRRHPQHQKHVGERKRQQFLWKSSSCKQGHLGGGRSEDTTPYIRTFTQCWCGNLFRMRREVREIQQDASTARLESPEMHKRQQQQALQQRERHPQPQQQEQNS